MTTKPLLPPTEFPKMRATRSRQSALKEWRDFLALQDIQGQITRRIVASSLREMPRFSPKRVPTWDQDRLIDFALNASYPDDIEQQIEQSWRR